MSTIRATTISDLAGTGPATLTGQYGVKVWSRVDYSGGTPVIADSFNISSVSDVAVGTVGNTYTSAMSDTNYSAAVTALIGSRVGAISGGVQLAGSINTVVNLSNTASEADVARNLSCIGDLA